MNKVIAIDFDGCIASYIHGWQGENVFGEIIPGCKEKIHLLASKGHKIIIHTARLPTKELEKFLKDNGIWFDALNENPWHKYKQPGGKRKVIADIYIDDRAITFKGNWDEIPELVENFKTWEVAKNPSKEYSCSKCKNDKVRIKKIEDGLEYRCSECNHLISEYYY